MHASYVFIGASAWNVPLLVEDHWVIMVQLELELKGQSVFAERVEWLVGAWARVVDVWSQVFAV